MNSDHSNRVRIPAATGEISFLPTSNGYGVWMDVQNNGGSFTRVFIRQAQFDNLVSAVQNIAINWDDLSDDYAKG